MSGQLADLIEHFKQVVAAPKDVGATITLKQHHIEMLLGELEEREASKINVDQTMFSLGDIAGVIRATNTFNDEYKTCAIQALQDAADLISQYHRRIYGGEGIILSQHQKGGEK